MELGNSENGAIVLRTVSKAPVTTHRDQDKEGEEWRARPSSALQDTRFDWDGRYREGITKTVKPRRSVDQRGSLDKQGLPKTVYNDAENCQSCESASSCIQRL